MDANRIGRANVDGTGVNPSFISGVPSPYTIATDGTYLYGANGGLPSIARASLDGAGVDQTFIPLVFPATGLAVDATGIYRTTWPDPFGRYPALIGRANLDGTGANHSLIEGNGLAGVAVDQTYIHWANNSSGTIGRAFLYGTGVDQSFRESLLRRA
jgi:hypothetical protein